MSHAVPLRCQLCGEQIGLRIGEPPDPKIAVIRCYQCAAIEEAEQITRLALVKDEPGGDPE